MKQTHWISLSVVLGVKLLLLLILVLVIMYRLNLKFMWTERF